MIPTHVRAIKLFEIKLSKHELASLFLSASSPPASSQSEGGKTRAKKSSACDWLPAGRVLAVIVTVGSSYGGCETAFYKFRETRNVDEIISNFAKFCENKIVNFREICERCE